MTEGVDRVATVVAAATVARTAPAGNAASRTEVAALGDPRVSPPEDVSSMIRCFDRPDATKA